jgi:hypothetical protein
MTDAPTTRVDISIAGEGRLAPGASGARGQDHAAQSVERDRAVSRFAREGSTDR